MDVDILNHNEALGREDHFSLLPDELLLFIFNKMSDLKNLCHCYLVSKRFASIIPQILSVSFTLPRTEAYSCESYKRAITLLNEVSQLTSDVLPEFLKQSFHKLNLPIFLEKFPELESFYLEYAWPKNDGNTSLLKWRVNCRSDTAVVTNFAAMLPRSVHKRSEFVLGQELLTRENFQTKDCLWSSYGCYAEWMFLIYTLINCHATLRSVTVTDSGKKGKLVISNEHLIRLRKSRYLIRDQVNMNLNFDLNKDQVMNLLKSSVKIAWVPELHLPVSGYVMREVCLVAIKFSNESDATWDFEEEDEVFGEVIKEVFKNHRDKILPPF